MHVNALKNLGGTNLLRIRGMNREVILVIEDMLFINQ